MEENEGDSQNGWFPFSFPFKRRLGHTKDQPCQEFPFDAPVDSDAKAAKEVCRCPFNANLERVHLPNKRHPKTKTHAFKQPQASEPSNKDEPPISYTQLIGSLKIQAPLPLTQFRPLPSSPQYPPHPLSPLSPLSPSPLSPRRGAGPPKAVFPVRDSKMPPGGA